MGRKGGTAGCGFGRGDRPLTSLPSFPPLPCCAGHQRLDHFVRRGAAAAVAGARLPLPVVRAPAPPLAPPCSAAPSLRPAPADARTRRRLAPAPMQVDLVAGRADELRLLLHRHCDERAARGAPRPRHAAAARGAVHRRPRVWRVQFAGRRGLHLWRYVEGAVGVCGFRHTRAGLRCYARAVCARRGGRGAAATSAPAPSVTLDALWMPLCAGQAVLPEIQATLARPPRTVETMMKVGCPVCARGAQGSGGWPAAPCPQLPLPHRRPPPPAACPPVPAPRRNPCPWPRRV